jgi:hypothetical protein
MFDEERIPRDGGSGQEAKIAHGPGDFSSRMGYGQNGDAARRSSK